MATAAEIAAAAARRERRRTVGEVMRAIDACMAGEKAGETADPDSDFAPVVLAMTEVKAQAAARERALAEETSRKNDLITYLAHDLKTPLTSFVGYLAIIDEAPDLPQDLRRRYVSTALDKARRLEGLIGEFFEITRYNLSHIELEKSDFDLAFMLDQVADEFHPQLAAHGNAMEVAVEPRPLMVRADADRLARVFSNLVRNAVAYSTEGTPIKIDTSVEEGSVRVSVTDVGVTIPSYRLDSIFDKFFRVDGTRSSSTGGSGLGLAIAREILGLHGGTIAASSRDGVTTFEVVLPIALEG